MPQQTKFNVGDLVKYNEWDGYIVFTCTNYIVVCIRHWEDKEALHGVVHEHADKAMGDLDAIASRE